MRPSTTGSAEFDRLHVSFRRAEFSGASDGPGTSGDDSDFDSDEFQLLDLIERDGFIRAEDLAAEWD